MFVKIAICDDEKFLCSMLEQVLQEKIREEKILCEIDIVESGEDLCSRMQTITYDMIFLKIEMPIMSGIEVGRYIRETMKNEKVQIIYFSEREEYAMELFDYRPLNFLIKPLHRKDIRKVIDKYILISEKNNDRVFEYKKGYEVLKVPFSEILYFESRGRKVYIVTQNGEDAFYAPLDVVYQKIKDAYFLCIHKSIVVNYRFVTMFSSKEVTMANGTCFSISQARRKEVRKRYMEMRKIEYSESEL